MRSATNGIARAARTCQSWVGCRNSSRARENASEQNRCLILRLGGFGAGAVEQILYQALEGQKKSDEAARRYSEEIRSFLGLGESDLPHFDVIHRGIGADAHTASLFPGEPLIDSREGIAAAVWVEKMRQWRITLLPSVLRAARALRARVRIASTRPDRRHGDRRPRVRG